MGLALGLFVSVQAEEARLLRFPATNGTDVVFTFAGDLYTAPLSGGEARRLTSQWAMRFLPVTLRMGNRSLLPANMMEILRSI